MESKVISYLEFRRAAYRNLAVCEILLKKYDSETPVMRKHILYKTYYLGGYVVEFLYKFSLFSHLNLNHTQDVYKCKNLDFQKRWRVHDYAKLNVLCEDEGLIFSSDIPFLGNKTLNKNIEKLFDAWDVQIRYSINLSRKKVDLQYSVIVKYIETIKDINNKINSIYS